MEKQPNIPSSPSSAEKPSAEKLSVINEAIEKLKAQAEKARAEKEAYLTKKIVDLETLTAKGDEVAKLQQAAKETLANLAPLRDDPQLKDDPELQKQIESAESISTQLATQVQEIFTEIDKIGKQQDVTHKIDVEGMETNRQIEADKKLKEDFEKDTKEFVDKVVEYTDALNAWYAERDRLFYVRSEEARKLGSLVNETLEEFPRKNIGEDKISLSGVINIKNQHITSSKQVDEIIKNLSEDRKSLRLFGSGREKKLIDSILSKKAEFDAYKKVCDEADTKQNELTSLDTRKSALKAEYKSLIDKYGYGKVGAYDLTDKFNLSSKEGMRNHYRDVLEQLHERY
jgi:hypothetical protein